ncbi:MAG: hypothetical protein LH479_12930 [Polaromonas sp.]|nr:hypothetical protein [Polaromonas sp.]
MGWKADFAATGIFPSSRFTIWHAADPGLSGDMKFNAQHYKPDLVRAPGSTGPPC